jgi:hypothetical protein
MHTTESLEPEPSSFEDIAIQKLKRYVIRYLSNFGRTDPSKR